MWVGEGYLYVHVHTEGREKRGKKESEFKARII